MQPDIHQKVYLLEAIRTPQHPLINTIWRAFNNINFSIPVTDWIDSAQFSQPYFSDIKIWHPNSQGKPELLAGFRSFNIAKAIDLNEITITEYIGINEAAALEISINDILWPLLLWSHGNKSSNVQVLNFCKNIRKNLPDTYRKQLPRQAKIRHLLEISEYVGKKQPVTTSKIVRLRQALSATTDVNNEESVHHGEN